MTAMITKATARKRYPCTWDCGSHIEPGQPYIRWALPPWTDGNDDDHWTSGTAHGQRPEECPTFIHGQPHPAMDTVEAS